MSGRWSGLPLRMAVPVAALMGAVLVVAGCSAKRSSPAGTPSSASTSSTSGASSAPAGTIACGAPQPAPIVTQTYSAEPAQTIDPHRNYTMTLHTSCGTITAKLYADKAPHTVNAFAFLAGHMFFDGTFCHRLTTSPSLTVLQCGDPTGTGRGVQGMFTLPDENTHGGYTRGTLAMANAGPNTGSSQFFLVDQDATLPASYSVFGRITSGLDVLDRIIAIGEDDANGPGDGAPKLRVYLTSVTVTAG